MKLYIYIHPDLHNMYVYYYYTIPNRSRIGHVWSWNERPISHILTLSTYFEVLPYNSQWTKVDNNLPEHTSTLVHSRFIKIIRNISIDGEIYHVSVRDTLYHSHYIKANIRQTSLLHISKTTEQISISFEDS